MTPADPLDRDVPMRAPQYSPADVLTPAARSWDWLPVALSAMAVVDVVTIVWFVTNTSPLAGG